MRTNPKLCFVALLCFMQLISCKKESTSMPVTSSSVDEVVAKARLVAWYKFTNGNTGDFSGNNNHLTAYNVTRTTDYLGRPNNAVAFNGFSSFMQAANSASLNPSKISLVALVKSKGYTGNGADSRILMKGIDDQSDGTYFLGYNNSGTIYGTYGNNQYESNGVPTPPNSLQFDKWYKLIYTYDGKVGKLYIDGALVGQNNKVATFTPNNDFLRIGTTGRSDYPYWFNGAIDEIRIYNSALTPNQVILVTNELGK